jgi:hypothetical protein
MTKVEAEGSSQKDSPTAAPLFYKASHFSLTSAWTDRAVAVGDERSRLTVQMWKEMAHGSQNAFIQGYIFKFVSNTQPKAFSGTHLLVTHLPIICHWLERSNYYCNLSLLVSLSTWRSQAIIFPQSYDFQPFRNTHLIYNGLHFIKSPSQVADCTCLWDELKNYILKNYLNLWTHLGKEVAGWSQDDLD